MVITGAASGIGAATAKLFAAQGWLVGLADVDEAGLALQVAALRDAKCAPLALDVRHRDQWDRALAEFAEHSGGRLDLLVNNAGVFTVGALKDMDEDDIQRMVDVNLMGVLHGVRAAHPLLAATEGAQIINIASFLAFSGAGNGAVYSATKAAVRNLTEALAIELRYDGIQVSDILPGFVTTGFFAGNDRQAKLGGALADAGVKFITAERVATAVWDATRRYRLHRTVGQQAKLLALVARLVPGQARSAVRRISKRLMKAGL